MKRVLVTGGAGFIGSHVVALLLLQGCQVMSFDALLPQVHPQSPKWPDYQPDHENLAKYVGDVRDLNNSLMPAIREFQPDTIIHLAAMVGVGQSNYQAAAYTSANITGTMALLHAVADWNEQVLIAQERKAALENLIGREPCHEDGSPISDEEKEHIQRELNAELENTKPGTFIDQVFVAGSMSSYGEGMRDHNGTPVPTDELWPLNPASIYAWTKAQQEEGALLLNSLRPGILNVKIGRFFNAYGRNQALTNPYTGVAAIFSASLLSGVAPVIYGDGSQTRDFIHVSDVADGILAIVERGDGERGDGEIYNIGTGIPTSVLMLATLLAREIHGDAKGDPIAPNVTNLIRSGDILHCYADSRKLQALGWEPKVSLEDGVKDLIQWVREQPAQQKESMLYRAHEELMRYNLLRPAMPEAPPPDDMGAPDMPKAPAPKDEDFITVVSDIQINGFNHVVNHVVVDPDELGADTTIVVKDAS